MTEEDIKALCKWAIENRKQSLSKEKKEFIKQAIDESNTIEDLFTIAIFSNLIGY